MDSESTEQSHQAESAPLGIILTNVGTPAAPTTSAIRRYLREFLSDRHIVRVPRVIWWFILNFFILPIRPSKVAHAYRTIWMKQGSPLLLISNNQASLLKKALDDKLQEPFHLVMAMRYGVPSLKAGLEKLRSLNVRRIIVLPLYPQYSSTTTGSTIDMINDTLKRWPSQPKLHVIHHYAEDPSYINAIANSILRYWKKYKQPEKLIFSFHGIPERYVLGGDPYYGMCHTTARLVAEKLQLENTKWLIAFQSRFGFAKWLKPYTDEVLQLFAKQGIKDVDVVCPGFAADCLETLEEINLRYKQLYLQAGGEKIFLYSRAQRL